MGFPQLFHEPADLMNPLKRSSVDCSIDSGEPFALLQCIPIPLGGCPQDNEFPCGTQCKLSPSAKDTLTFIVCNVPRNGQSKSGCYFFRRHPQKSSFVHEGIEFWTWHCNVNLIDRSRLFEHCFGHLLNGSHP